MPIRAISRTSISFGMVSIPVELFPATASKSIHFNLLHAKDDSRIEEKIYCIAEDKLIDRKELVHGFQIQKGNYVTFTNDELKKLEAGAGHEIEILEFIPLAQVDPVYFASSYLLGCGSGAAKAYHLLNAAMSKSQRAALAKFVLRGKEHLVLIRPYHAVLMLHTMHYANEIRSADEIEHGADKAVGASEMKLAERLIDELSKDQFEADRFADTYREKILKIAEQKAAGQKIAAPSAPKRGKVIDLMSALRDSLKAGGKNAPKDRREEAAPDDQAANHHKRVRRVAKSSRHTQVTRRARS
jgi:DNA end-binding protein Ku